MTLEATAPTTSHPDGSPIDVPPELFLNRELSWLAFNQRVLEEAEDTTNPLLERVKFLAIFSANLDEFFMIRVANLKRKISAGIADPGLDGVAPQALAPMVRPTRAPGHRTPAAGNAARRHRRCGKRLCPR